MELKEKVLKLVLDTGRISTFDVQLKFPDVMPRDISHTLYNLKLDGLIKVVATKKVKRYFGTVLHTIKYNVYAPR